MDAIVVADSPLANVAIAGLTARERARRVAERAGAGRVVVVDNRAQLAEYRSSADAVLVIWADQLVHGPLVAPLVAASLARDGVAIAVGPANQFARAAIASGRAIEQLLALVVVGDDAGVERLATTRLPHGEIACHPIDSAADRAAAHRMLYRLITKPQDNVITRYLFRPISARITRLLVHTPITPTQLSLAVAALVAVGCWMTLDRSPAMLLGGALVILGASYLDCCDGEIARIKLQSSTFGAWLDTIVDEASSIGYMVALGWHCHAYYGRDYFGALGFDPWIAGIVVGVVTFGWSLFAIYYNIIAAVGSGNSQDYVGRFVVSDEQRDGRPVWRLVAKPSKQLQLPDWLMPVARFLPNIVRRDFIVWVATLYAVFNVPHVSFLTHLAGGVASCIVTLLDHVHLRGVQRKARRAGRPLVRVRG